jgi:hypothetical protein
LTPSDTSFGGFDRLEGRNLNERRYLDTRIGQIVKTAVFEAVIADLRHFPAISPSFSLFPPGSHYPSNFILKFASSAPKAASIFTQLVVVIFKLTRNLKEEHTHRRKPQKYQFYWRRLRK